MWCEAAIRLATLYFDGTRVSQDYVTAAQWFNRAAQAGNPEAQLRLGILYRDGVGVHQDDVLAHMWLNLAAARFSADENERRAYAVISRDALRAQMSAEEFKEAVNMTRQWQPK